MYKAIPFDPLDKECIYIDVRSESEYAKGHIITAINLPILHDIERHEVGLIYKNSSVEDAKKIGIKYGSEKLQLFFDTITELRKLNPTRKIVFYCARGGYRSRSIALLMRSIDIPVYWLNGGYKAYRQEVLSRLNSPDNLPTFIVINGLSGVGKTHVLNALEKLNLSTLDLEGAANHKGSHLGKIGTNEVQSVQAFENNLFYQLNNINQPFCFVESESKRIGQVFVPQEVFDKMQAGIQILLEADFDFRIKGLVEDYVNTNNFEALFLTGLDKIKIYISKEIYNELLGYYNQKDYEALAKGLLNYHYDPIYSRSIEAQPYTQSFNVESYDTCAKNIKDWFINLTLSQ